MKIFSDVSVVMEEAISLLLVHPALIPQRSPPVEESFARKISEDAKLLVIVVPKISIFTHRNCPVTRILPSISKEVKVAKSLLAHPDFFAQIRLPVDESFAR